MSESQSETKPKRDYMKGIRPALEVICSEATSRAETKENIIRFIEYHEIVPAMLAAINRRYNRTAKRFGTTAKQLVSELEQEGRVQARFNSKRNKFYIYPIELYRELNEKVATFADPEAFLACEDLAERGT